jgi:hypothetical protein
MKYFLLIINQLYSIEYQRVMLDIGLLLYSRPASL